MLFFCGCASLFFVGILSLDAPTAVYYEESGGELVAASVPPLPPPPKHISTPEEVKAVYMTSWIASASSLRKGLVSFVDESDLNSIVIDVKDYSGRISFQTEDPRIREVGSDTKRIEDIKSFIEELHRKGIYVIARITVFQDPYIATIRPEVTVKDSRGGIWRDRNNLAYVDPGSNWYWDYTVRIARASERVGFDELNFDYIRFPSDGPLAYAIFPESGNQVKADVLENFFRYLNTELSDVPVPLSVDLFGLTTWNNDDLNIGQVLERVAPYFDYIAPMVYPSHYASGFQNFVNPAEHPYEIVNTAMLRGMFRLKEVGQDPQKLRPWIQDFDLGADYDVEKVRDQIRAVHDAGLNSYMSWDPSNRYTREAY